MINLSIYCIIAFALLGSSFYFLLTNNKQDKFLHFSSLLSPDQQKTLKNITEERLYIYIQGFIIGIIIGLIFIRISNIKNNSIFCIFVAIVLGFTYIHYTLFPKSTYMLEHIDTSEQAKAWLEIYKTMKNRCHIGMLLGVISLPFICYLIN